MQNTIDGLKRIRDEADILINALETPVPEPEPSVDPTFSMQPTILAHYWQVLRAAAQSGTVANHNETKAMRYVPGGLKAGVPLFDDGSFAVANVGEFAGWDLLRTREHRHASVNYGARDFVYLKLNRPAEVGVVWQGDPAGIPVWLHSWTRNGTLGTRAVFRKVLPAGENWLGTNEGRNVQMYSVIMREADGKLWTQPVDPLGRDVPPVGSVVPRDHWLHRRHFAKGPDGNMYPTWHEQIDSVFWVRYSHEHGSDPANFAAHKGGWFMRDGQRVPWDVSPLWRYSDPDTSPANSLSFFKVLTFDHVNPHDGRTYSHMFLVSKGSSDITRLQKKTQTWDHYVADRETKEIVAALHHQAGFGRVRVNDSAGRFFDPSPETYPDNLNERGIKNIPLQSNFGYESWQASYGAALPIRSLLAVVTHDPMARLTETKDAAGRYLASATTAPTSPGALRWFNSQNIPTNPFTIDASIRSGEFYADRLGMEAFSEPGPDRLWQYVRPGVKISVIDNVDLKKFIVLNPWTADYVISDFMFINRQLEGGFTAPN